jgi:hypothetical protein
MKLKVGNAALNVELLKKCLATMKDMWSLSFVSSRISPTMRGLNFAIYSVQDMEIVVTEVTGIGGGGEGPLDFDHVCERIAKVRRDQLLPLYASSCLIFSLRFARYETGLKPSTMNVSSKTIRHPKTEFVRCFRLNVRVCV